MEAWLENELSSCVFKDKRLDDRFKSMVARLSQGVGQSIPQIGENWAMAKATYRFLSNDSVEESEILSGHFEQTRQRAEACDGPLLILHDTTEFTYHRTQPQAIGFSRRLAYPVKAPSTAERNEIVHTISQRIARKLEREGLLERDTENAYLQLDGLDEDPMHQLQGHSITYRIAVGHNRGRQVFTLQTLPPIEPES